MSEDTAVEADAGTEMVFRMSLAHGVLGTAMCASGIVLISMIIAVAGPGLLNVYSLICMSFAFVGLCLDILTYECRFSGGTLTYQRFWWRRVIEAGQVHSAKWAYYKTLRITYEREGKIRRVKIRCGFMRSQDWRRLRSALREAWPDKFPE